MRFLVLLTALLAITGRASADEPPPTQGVLGLALHGSEAGPGITLDARLVRPRGTQVGLTLTGQAFGIGHFSGQVVHDAASLEPGLVVLAPLVRAPGFELALRVGAGARFGYELAGQRRHATRVVSEIALFAHLLLRERGLLRLGALVGMELEVSPLVELADQSQLVVVSGGFAITPTTLLFASLEGGGTYGFGGDNGKVVLRGSVGVRVSLSGDARTPF